MDQRDAIRSAAMREAVERIVSDPAFAQRAYEDPASTLAEECGLDDDEVRTVHAALVADVADAQGEVAGFAMFEFGSAQIEFTNVSSLTAPTARDAGTGVATGRRQYQPLQIRR